MDISIKVKPEYRRINSHKQKYPLHSKEQYINKALLKLRFLPKLALCQFPCRFSGILRKYGINMSKIEAKCTEKGLKMTGQRRVIAKVISESHDHPDVELLYQRAVAVDPHISIATVYRTVKLFEEAGITQRHDFGDGRARYEEASESHHDHLIDLKSGRVIEFTNEEIERLQKEIAKKLGYRLVDHRLELYAVPVGDAKNGKY
jgi:Fur family ferric uptake transcriptional regulator